MAVKNNIVVDTCDMEYAMPPDKLIEFFESDTSKWAWLKDVSSEAQEYYFANIKPAKDEVQGLEAFTEDDLKKPSRPIDLKYYPVSSGELGEFISQTRRQHGGLVAFYALQIATNETNKVQSVNKSDAIRRSSSYEFQLAHFLYFQHINAADYISGDTRKKLNSVLESFNSAALMSLEDIDKTGDAARKILSGTTKELDRVHAKYKRRAMVALRRYRSVFSTVRKEANDAREAANNDLKKAYETYHAQVDLKSSIVYWNEKVIQHDKAKWIWLGVVAVSIILTFASPVIYYSVGGASALAANRHQDLHENLQTPQPVTAQKDKEAPKQPEDQKQEVQPAAAAATIEKVALASGIADLTGAALIVALMSVFLRLSLRQYNTYMHLSHDAEERVTMLKTYLALSNEGKLTVDGDMKLVLEALFRPSQFAGVPDSTPATPIELIIKAFTEKK